MQGIKKQMERRQRELTIPKVQCGKCKYFFYPFQKLPMKDFSLEVRAAMDVKNFLKKTVLILDLNKLSLDEIIDEILHKLLDSSDSKHSFDQARSALFTHDCGKLIRCQSWWVYCISFYFPLKISLSFKWRCHHHRQNLDL